MLQHVLFIKISKYWHVTTFRFYETYCTKCEIYVRSLLKYLKQQSSFKYSLTDFLKYFRVGYRKLGRPLLKVQPIYMSNIFSK